MLINCQHCGKEFIPARHWQSFCTPKCRNDYHNGLTKHDRRSGADRSIKLDLPRTPVEVRRL